MKTLLILISFTFFCLTVFGQKMPSDSILLKCIFGNIDVNGKTSTIDKPEELIDDMSEDSLRFGVVFKSFAFVENQKIIIVICEAEERMLQGHIWGFTNSYYLKLENDTVTIINKNIQEESSPIGDNSNKILIKIGKSKSAIVSTFSSTGNHHYERDITFSLLTFDGPIPLFNIPMDYSNEAWVNSDISENEECRIESHMSSFTIIESDKEWFNIRIDKTSVVYGKGCIKIDEITESQIYSYKDNVYQM